jgi:hypothetical protein
MKSNAHSAHKNYTLKVHKELLQFQKENLVAQRKLREQASEIAKNIAINKRQYIQYSPIQVGDKVLAKGAKCITRGIFVDPEWKDVEGFISSVKVIIGLKDEVKYVYDVNAIKKDGKMSQRLIDGYYTRGMELSQIKRV